VRCFDLSIAVRLDLAGARIIFHGYRMEIAKPQILLVEDDAPVREALQELLEAEGYLVEVAENGLAALRRLRAGFRPAAVLLDLMMPVMDGWQFREEQQADADLKDIPVFILTAANLSVLKARGQLEGVTILTKPLDDVALLQLLAAIGGDRTRAASMSETG
jgi:CheY-like chemotaxis protein